MKKFLCPKCQTRFDAEEIRKDYTSVIYGPCHKYIAMCPQCGGESDEYQYPAKASSSPSEFSCEGNCSRCSRA